MHSLLLQKTPMSIDEAEEMITNREDIDFPITKNEKKIGAISVLYPNEREENAKIGYFITT